MPNLPSCDFSDCTEALKQIGPIYDEIVRKKESTFEREFHDLYTKMTFEQFKKIKKFYAELGVDVFAWFDVDAGGSTEEEQFRTYSESIKKNIEERVFDNKVEELMTRTISADVLRTYRHCIDNKLEACKLINSGTGLRVLEVNRSGDEIHVTIQSILYPGDSEVVVEHFYFPSTIVSCENPLKKGDHIRGEHCLIFKRIGEGEGRIVIDTTKNTLQIPISQHVTSEMLRKVNEDLVQFMTDKLRDVGFKLPFTMNDGTNSGPVLVELWYNGGMASTTFKIPCIDIDRKLNYHYLGGGHISVYSPNVNSSHCVGIRLDSGRILENFCVGTDEIASVIKAKLDAYD